VFVVEDTTGEAGMDPTRTIWVDDDGQQWRVEQVAGRWQLSRWAPGEPLGPSGPMGGTWTPVGSYPNRQAAVLAAADR
jgi:hypothetical protein